MHYRPLPTLLSGDSKNTSILSLRFHERDGLNQPTHKKIIMSITLSSFSVPQHIAIIMDGNGRWAKHHNLPLIEGHRQGGKTAEAIILEAKKQDIGYLTLYTFSSENFKRSPLWVAELLHEFEHYLEHKSHFFKDHGIRVRFIGQLSLFSTKLQNLMQKVEDETSSFTQLSVQFAVAYGARQELTHATQQIARAVQLGTISPQNITEELISSYLYTKNMPDPDLLIRTSGEMRISNYLLWQNSYAEFFFPTTLWPDFTPRHFTDIIHQWNERVRCFGKDRQAA